MPVKNAEKPAVKNQTTMELRGDRELVIARTFNGPARVVFDAWTRPELVRRWWAPSSHNVSVVVCEADVRAGGAWRYVLRRDTGDEFAFSGVYQEVTPHSRLVYTNWFEAIPGAEVLCTITFEERGGKTHLVSHELYPSAEAREGALSAGMEHGMRETMDQLDELVASLS
jgi:uncharacterized protein YndB with AHSA1/START domain